jgi:hypothetical protein
VGDEGGDDHLAPGPGYDRPRLLREDAIQRCAHPTERVGQRTAQRCGLLCPPGRLAFFEATSAGR